MRTPFLNVFLLNIALFCHGQQLDPIDNMCIRFDQQSVIKNNVLYIDGGRQTYINTTKVDGKTKQVGNITLGYNNHLIAVDLTKSWDWKTNISEVALEKSTNPKTGTRVPVLSRGALYHGSPSDDNIYLWGGTTSPWNKSFPGYRSPLPAQYSLWSFNTKDQTWGQFDTGLTIENRPNSGASAEAIDQSLAFYFNGQLDTGSQIQTEYTLRDDTKPFLEGMVVINTQDKTARNLSTQAVVGNHPRTRGEMVYIPNIGSNGVLVQVGGNHKDVRTVENQYVGDLVPMDSVDIFDIASYYNSSTPDGTWYKQNVTGDIPPGRIDHCLMLASAIDNSSHNLYLYGGRSWDGKDNVVYDDIYILSIPSFTWTKVYQGSSDLYAHNCHRANANTMITVGGARNFNYDRLPCDWKLKGVGVLDLSEITWGSVYDASDNEYKVPSRVVTTIGGNRDGGATMRQPLNGFDDEGLALMLNGTYAKAKKPAKKRLGGPFIAAYVVGSLAIFAVVGISVYFYRRRLQAAIGSKEWFRAEMDGEGRVEAETTERLPVQELPAPIKCVRPCSKPVELCARDSDLPWRELGGRNDMPWNRSNRTSMTTPPPPWEPPVTDLGIPF